MNRPTAARPTSYGRRIRARRLGALALFGLVASTAGGRNYQPTRYNPTGGFTQSYVTSRNRDLRVGYVPGKGYTSLYTKDRFALNKSYVPWPVSHRYTPGARFVTGFGKQFAGHALSNVHYNLGYAYTFPGRTAWGYSNLFNYYPFGYLYPARGLRGYTYRSGLGFPNRYLYPYRYPRAAFYPGYGFPHRYGYPFRGAYRYRPFHRYDYRYIGARRYGVPFTYGYPYRFYRPFYPYFRYGFPSPYYGPFFPYAFYPFFPFGYFPFGDVRIYQGLLAGKALEDFRDQYVSYGHTFLLDKEIREEYRLDEEGYVGQPTVFPPELGKRMYDPRRFEFDERPPVRTFDHDPDRIELQRPFQDVFRPTGVRSYRWNPAPRGDWEYLMLYKIQQGLIPAPPGLEVPGTTEENDYLTLTGARAALQGVSQGSTTARARIQPARGLRIEGKSPDGVLGPCVTKSVIEESIDK